MEIYYCMHANRFIARMTTVIRRRSTGTDISSTSEIRCGRFRSSLIRWSGWW